MRIFCILLNWLYFAHNSDLMQYYLLECLSTKMLNITPMVLKYRSVMQPVE